MWVAKFSWGITFIDSRCSCISAEHGRVLINFISRINFSVVAGSQHVFFCSVVIIFAPRRQHSGHASCLETAI